MATAWTVGDKILSGSGGLTWDSLSSSGTDDYDQSSIKWNHISWSFSAQNTGEIGIQWDAMLDTWGADTRIYVASPWTITRVTKIQTATET